MHTLCICVQDIRNCIKDIIVMKEIQYIRNLKIGQIMTRDKNSFYEMHRYIHF